MQSNPCYETSSDVAVISVNSKSFGGNVESYSKCTNESGDIILHNNNGEVNKWQTSSNMGINWDDIAITSDTLHFNDISFTTQYRAIVKNGVCTVDTSNISTITVYESSNGGILTGSDTVVYGNNSGILKLKSFMGDVNRWETSPTGLEPWSVIVNETDSLNYENMISTTYYRVIVTNGPCSTDTSSIAKITVSPLSVGGIVNGSATVCSEINNGNLLLSGNTGDIIKWQYSKNNGTTWIDTAVTVNKFTYNNLITTTLYRVQVKSGVCEPEFSEQAQIEVSPLPVVSFNADSVCFNTPTIFNNTSSISEGSLVSYNWNFNNGESSISPNPVYIFPASGSHNVKLSVISDKGCVDFVSSVVVVLPNPIPHFNWDDVCFNDTTNFTVPDYVSTETYYWNFGNASDSSTGASTYHIFPEYGTHDVKLKVVSQAGCIDSITNNVMVYPRANVDFSFNNVCDGNTMNFTNNSTISKGNLYFLWNFGDGKTSTLENPDHLYSSYGKYNVKLIAYSEKACSDTSTNEIYIHPNPIPDFQALNVCDGYPTSFIDKSIIPSGTIVSFLWDFGDQSNSIQQNPSKQYLNPDNYLVKLSTTSNFGCTKNTTKTVNVNSNPIANFIYDNVCLGEPVKFSNLSSIENGFFDVLWDFGDGYTSIADNPSHYYDTSGVFSVKLIARSENNCIDSLIRNVQVYSLPKVNAGKDTVVSKGYSTTLNGSGGVEYLWSPIEGLSNPTSPNPFATPLITTDYILRAKDFNSCVNYDTVKISVIDEHKIVVSNVITPDGNEINDCWKIENIKNYGNCDVNIFNCWGTEVYSKHAYQNDWKGTNSNGDILPDGTYYYVIKFSDSEIVYKGALTILRNR